MSSGKLLAGYLGLVGVPLLALLMVLRRAGLPSPLDASIAVTTNLNTSAVPEPATSAAFLLLLQIAVVLCASRLVGILFRCVGQPQVMGEMVAGILLGPSLLGKLAPTLSAALFSPSSLSHLAVLSQFGLVLFMFLVGFSLSPHGVQEWRHASVLTSHVSIALPFVLGSSVAVYLHSSFAGPGVSVPAFALFMGAAMSITAFPVLARILAERNLLNSRIGTLAVACAAVDDVTGWCILAYITVVLRVSRSAVPLWFTLSGCLAFIAVMVCLVRPLLRRFDEKFVDKDGLHESGLFLILLLMLAAALTTEYLGIHVLFGSFFAGAILPKNAGFVTYLRQKLESFTLLLLPLFFAFTGLRTNIGYVHGLGMWAIAVLLLAIGIVGKMGGSTLAGRWAGLTWRDAATVGALLNTRGLMELVILNIGLDLGLITPPLFTMMVMMAIATTLTTAPLLGWLRPSSTSACSFAVRWRGSLETATSR